MTIVMKMGLTAASLGIMFAAGVAMPSFAELASTAQQASVIRISASNTPAGSAVSFDWFSNSQSAAQAYAARATLAAAHVNLDPGHGHWICSPAGFGSQSHCFAR